MIFEIYTNLLLNFIENIIMKFLKISINLKLKALEIIFRSFLLNF